MPSLPFEKSPTMSAVVSTPPVLFNLAHALVELNQFDEADELIDQRRVDQRTVGGDSHHHISSMQPRRVGVSREHVKFAAAVAGYALLRAHCSNRIVGDIGGGGDDNAIGSLHAAQPFHQPHQHGLTGQRQQHLARQAGRGHA